MQITIIDEIGYRNPELLLLFNSIVLLDQKKYLGVYLLFFLVDYYLIGFTKNLIKQPRPIGFSDSKYYDGGDYTKSYGMQKKQQYFLITHHQIIVLLYVF